MSEPETSRKHRSPALFAVLLFLVLVISGWREWDHRKHIDRLQDIESELRQSLLQAEADRMEWQELAQSRIVTIEDQEIALQSLEDRGENLQAQRDHLKAESDRLANRMEAMQSSMRDLESQLEQTRIELLAAQAQPQELSGQLKASMARNAALEARLDEHAGAIRYIPSIVEIAGLSADKTVFSLSGELSEGTEFPVPVHLCGTDGIYLDGWIHRREDALLIGHVKRWQSGTSTLVKGQKVFILPRKSYEADPY
ncbi:MAG: hypothetical protein AB3N64_12230 [Puniceicoccaceae bacterium]